MKRFFFNQLADWLQKIVLKNIPQPRRAWSPTAVGAVRARAKKILSPEQNYSVSERQFSEANPALPSGLCEIFFTDCRDTNIL